MESLADLLQGKFVWVGLLLALFINHAFSASYYWVNIDCGSENSYKDSRGIEWKTDGDYIKLGQNRPVKNNGLNVPEQMDNLRFFKSLKKNCYSVPAYVNNKYLIRTGFFYGNYDGLGNPPTFDLVIDSNKWVTVITSMDEPVFYETIYAPRGGSIAVCVSRTQSNQLPFISSLEAMPLEETMYDKMNRNYAWFLNYRVHFGGNDVVRYPDDDYNRIWNPFTTPDYNSVTANFTELTNDCPDDPPFAVIQNAVEAADSNTSIDLSFDFSRASMSNYLALYFTEVIQLSADQKRSFSISVDDQDSGNTVTPQYQICDEVNITTNPGSGVMNISIIPTSDSSLPPLICAAEVYTASPTLVTGTFQDDLDGLKAIISSFSDQLQAWTGDPCLPNNTVWEWLGCNADDPPRVTSLLLSRYGLDGSIPEFDQMQALEVIHMENNGLSGTIPDFLGDLPNLKLLNLSHNNLEGPIPLWLATGRITYDLTGNPAAGQPPPPGNNPDQHPGNKNNESLNALYSLLFLLVIGYGVYWCYCKDHRTKPKPESVANGVPVARPVPQPQPQPATWGPALHVETTTTTRTTTTVEVD